MNTITFNDQFEKVNWEHPRLMLAGFSGGARNSPLIEWDSDMQTATINEGLSTHPNLCPRLPFSAFRANVKFRLWAGGFMHNRIWVEEWSRGLERGYKIAVQIMKFQGGAGEPILKGGGSIWLAEVKYTGNNRQAPSVRIAEFDAKSKKWEEPASSWLTEWTKYFHVPLIMLCSDFYNPHIHLTKVSPPKSTGRSVEWIKAREHYVLIHKSHPANRKENAGKKLVVDGDTIQRAAHSRRAHYRLLSSPVFKHKIGQRVWVRSSWCGPKEWTDRSGQIYRIVDIQNQN